MLDFDVIVIGGSAGSVEASMRVVRALPGDLPAAVFVVIHVPPHSPSRLPVILGRDADLPVAHARDGEALVPGRILVAPPDQHVTVTGTHIRVGRGPKENRHRPAVDPLLRSAARAFGPRVIAVMLSGGPGDGVRGCLAVQEGGGLVIVQDPDDAIVAAMPESILSAMEVHARLPVDDIGEALVELVTSRAGMESGPAVTALVDEDADLTRPVDDLTVGCPDCGGVARGTDRRGIHEFECLVGHAYSAQSLLAAQDAALERALWSAIRGLEEKGNMLGKLAERVQAAPAVSRRYRERAGVAATQASIIRDLVTTRSAAEIRGEDPDVSTD